MDPTQTLDSSLPLQSFSGEAKVVVIELFGGLLPATAALQKHGIQTVSYFLEVANDPLEVAATRWPSAIALGDIRLLSEKTLDDIVSKHTGALFWITGGVPPKDRMQ